MQQESFWKLGALSDAVLVEGLQRVVGAGRRTLAELVAHLCEVENRRIHLDAGYPSMFAYCTGRLGFSEDEASRRIDVARLARRAPIVFTRLADGRLSLSAAALLRPYLLAPNLLELVEAVSGRSVQGAREALAALFPRPDVATSIRKLSPSRTGARGAPPSVSTELASGTDGRETVDTSPLFERAASPEAIGQNARSAERTPEPTVPPEALAPRTPWRAQPLSPGRYKVQFTADAALKNKLELSRDLLRHAVPNGDLGDILSRALDLLIEDVMSRRFGKRRGKGAHTPSPPETTPSPVPVAAPRCHCATPAINHHPGAPRREPLPSAGLHANITGRAAHRAVLERDGLQCTWRGPDGTRCSSRAWLERDHRYGRGLGGPSNAGNVRHLCKAHNRRAAEHVYGTRHIAQAIRRKQMRRDQPPR